MLSGGLGLSDTTRRAVASGGYVYFKCANSANATVSVGVRQQVEQVLIAGAVVDVHDVVLAEVPD